MESIAVKEKKPEPRRELSDYVKEQINLTLAELHKGQQVTAVYYDIQEQKPLQLTGTVAKVDPHWQTLYIDQVIIEFSEFTKSILYKKDEG